MHTHFILMYNVPVKDGRTGERRIDHCNTGIREMKYLEPLLKSGFSNENVAVFKIKFKDPRIIDVRYDPEENRFTILRNVTENKPVL